jgi:hypothetical protein
MSFGFCNFCGERQRRRCDGKAGPLRAYRIVPVHLGGRKILSRRAFCKVWRAKTNTAIGNNVLTKSKTNKAIGNNVLTKSKTNTAIGNNVLTKSETNTAIGNNVLTKSKTNTAIGNNVLTKSKTSTAIGNNVFYLFSRRCAHRKIWECSYDGDASLLMLTTPTHQLTILFISACTVFLHCDKLGSVVDAKRM